METLGLLLVLLVMLALFIGVISLIVLIVMAILKKKLKVPGIITGASFGTAILAIVGLFIAGMIATTGDSTSKSVADRELPSSSANANSPDNGTTDTNVETSSDKEVEVPKRKSNTEESDEVTETDTPEEGIEEDTDLVTEDIDEEVVEKEIEETTSEVDPEDLSNYRTDYDIKDIERSPAEYKNELLSFEGKIIQVMEDEVFTSYRIAINDDYDRIVYLQTFSETLEERLLEDDYVTVYGVFDDLLTYETVLGANQTVPAFIAHGERIILN